MDLGCVPFIEAAQALLASNTGISLKSPARQRQPQLWTVCVRVLQMAPEPSLVNTEVLVALRLVRKWPVWLIV